jgi:4-amino-4-deoxy-L-arabinose transferase-like glycosyltransferase
VKQRMAEWWKRLDKRAFAVVMTAIIVRLIWIVAVKAQPVSDFLFYFLRSGEVARGQGYLFNGHATAYWPPGYPFVLAVFFKALGQSLAVAKLLNVAMWTVSAWLMYVLGKRIGGPTAGLIAGMVVALYPEYVFFTGLVASENLFVLLMSVSAVLLTFRPKSARANYGLAAVIGLLLGWGIITRPASVLLPLTICVVVWIVRRRDRGFTTALVIGLCGILAIAPWVIRNRVVMGEWVLATNGGASVWGGAHQGSTGTFMRPEEQPSWMKPAYTIEAELLQNREGGKVAQAYMRAHPWAWLSMAPTKLVGMFDEPGGLNWNLVYDANGMPGGKPVYRKLSGVELLVVKVAGAYRHVPNLMKRIQAAEWILGALGLAVAVVRKRRDAIWPLTIIAYWVVFQITLATGQPRYLVSAGPLLGPGIGFLVVAIAGLFGRAQATPESAELIEPAAAGEDDAAAV